MNLPDKIDQVVSLLEQAQRESLSKTKTASQDIKTLARMGIYREAKKASYTEALIEAHRKGAF